MTTVTFQIDIKIVAIPFLQINNYIYILHHQLHKINKLLHSAYQKNKLDVH